MTDKIWAMSATGMLRAYRSGALSPVTVMEKVLDRCASVNPRINALYDLEPFEAMEAARTSAARWQAGAPVGPLDGVPCVVKDSIAVRGKRMLRGLEARRDAEPDVADSPPAARLREAGAIIIAKSTMPDMGFFAAGVSSAFGVTRNPWDLTLNVGGSSAGSAAAVAAGLVPLAVGSDVGGSVRLPASHCGLVALKPSVGVVPHLPYSRDRSAGPITRSVEDTVLLMSVLSGRDATAEEPGAEMPEAMAPLDLAGRRIGLLLSMGDGPEVDPAVAALVRQAATVLQGCGAEIVEMETPVTFPFVRQLTTYFSVKAAGERAGLPEARRGQMLDVLSACCDRGDRMLAREFAAAMATVDKAQRLMGRAVDQVDFVLAPTMPIVNFPAEAVACDPAHPHDHVTFTALLNQTGQPAATVLCGFVGTSPVGLQLMAPRGQDLALLGACLAYERARGPLAPFPEVV